MGASGCGRVAIAHAYELEAASLASRRLRMEPPRPEHSNEVMHARCGAMCRAMKLPEGKGAVPWRSSLDMGLVEADGRVW